MTWYGSMLISSLSYFNWIHDLWFNFTRRLGKAWAAYSSEEGVWHIYDNGNYTYACPSDYVLGDRPQYIFNLENNHLIDTRAGLVNPALLQPCEYIGGSLYYDGESQDDMTDFISNLRIFGAQPSVRVLVWAWAVSTGRDRLGWLASRREPFEARLMDRNADDVIFTF